MKKVFTVSAVDEKEVAAELPGSSFSIAEKIAGRLAKIGIVTSGINGRTVDIQIYPQSISHTRESLGRLGLKIDNGCDAADDEMAAA